MRIFRAFNVSCLALVVFLTACQKGSTPPTDPGEPSQANSASKLGFEAEPEPDRNGDPLTGKDIATPTIASHMREHFNRGVRLRDAVAAGHIEAMQRDAKWMAQHELSTVFPENWKAPVEDFRNAAVRVFEAKILETAALAVTEMARSCGSCHDKLGGPQLKMTPAPPRGSRTDSGMERHQWAADQLWEALTTPSEDAWLQGTRALLDAPLIPGAVAGPLSVPPETEELARRVRDIARKAKETRDPSEWALRYAELLQTCAECHQVLQVEPRLEWGGSSRDPGVPLFRRCPAARHRRRAADGYTSGITGDRSTAMRCAGLQMEIARIGLPAVDPQFDTPRSRRGRAVPIAVDRPGAIEDFGRRSPSEST